MRHAVIEKLPLLAKQLGPEFFERELLPRTLDWLRDPVATIRDSAMEVRGLGCCVWFFFWVSCFFLGELVFSLLHLRPVYQWYH